MQGFQARARSAPGGAVGRRAAYGNGDPVPMIGIGAGGHARCVIDAMRSLAGRYRLVGLFDDDPRLCGQSVEGIPVLGAFAADRSGADALGAGAAFVGVGGVGLTSARRQVFLQLDAAGFELPAIVHRSAHVSPRAHLADAVQVLAGAIVNTGARLGERHREQRCHRRARRVCGCPRTRRIRGDPRWRCRGGERCPRRVRGHHPGGTPRRQGRRRRVRRGRQSRRSPRSDGGRGARSRHPFGEPIQASARSFPGGVVARGLASCVRPRRAGGRLAEVRVVDGPAHAVS